MSRATSTSDRASAPERPAPERSAPERSAPVPWAAPVPPSAYALLASARRGHAEATGLAAPGERYATAHLAALRGSAAVLAARTGPEDPHARGRVRNAWTLLARVAPEMGEWAAFFSAGARKRAAAEAGLRRAVTTREADDLLRDVATFLDLVEGALDAAAQALPGTTAVPAR